LTNLETAALSQVVFKILDRMIHQDAQDEIKQKKLEKAAALKAGKIANPNKREEAWMMNRQRELDKAGKKGDGGDFDAESFERQMMNNEHGSLMGKKKDKEAKKEKSKIAKAGLPKPKEAKKLIPIFMVPQGRTAMVNMYNVVSFLQDGTLDKSKKTRDDAKGPCYVERKNEKGKIVKFEIHDNIKSLKPEDWKRIVGCLVQGPAWQFKGWKWEKEGMAAIGDHCCLTYLHYEDEVVPANVKQWACRTFGLSKHKRHLDRPLASQLWRHFDNWALRQNFKHLAM